MAPLTDTTHDRDHDHDHEDLDTQIGLRERRFAQVVDELRMTLVDDMPVFFARAAKRAFLEQPAAADKLSDAQVRELKAQVKAAGTEAATALDASLADHALWAAPATPPENRRDLTAAPIWSQVEAAADRIGTLLDGFGLRGTEPIPYRPPAYFVGGRYLPALTEHYWRLCEELVALREDRKNEEVRSTRERLEGRWDDA